MFYCMFYFTCDRCFMVDDVTAAGACDVTATGDRGRLPAVCRSVVFASG